MDIQPYLPQLLWWASGLSLATLLATLVAVPWVVARLPRDYFSRANRSSWQHGEDTSLAGWALTSLKNLLGAVLVMLGVLMLFTPGQGILTLLVGLLLMNFPGKYHLEQVLVARPGVFRALNWLRGRRGVEPFELPVKH